eukprot:CAMPEP_0116151924 /NCGR_PEP_ID=MMETSP0329-20121206/20370_1 /TAXON_ID=697910 /ORGANISM="Pseudo-nitzschia arenysensis, Strain B593" /LENGTH=689 /DNA_ID=CAMNT_0003648597 /DNA_START=232 /DNA_END=2301 /DNA_ORIENTATION=+
MPYSIASWLLLALCICASLKSVNGSNDDDFYKYLYYGNSRTDDASSYQVDDAYYHYSNQNGNQNHQYYNNNANQNDDGSNYNNYNNNNDDANANNNNNNDDDANANANANANNDDANANNDDGENYYYEDVENDDGYDKQFQDDYVNIDLEGFDDVSISPVSCVNYNNGHFIKFEMFETANSYQCHFGQLGTFVVSIAHYMRAYFNYQALTYGNSFSLPDDVGYLNCIPLKMENYGFEYAYGRGDDQVDDANRRRVEEDEDENNQAILYAKLGCMYKETQTSTAFQLHVYTDDQCTQPYDDGQTDQQHAKHGYNIDLDQYYLANLDDDDDDAIQYTDYPKNTLAFSTKVSFRPSFYKCQTCKPSQISNTFNKFVGTFYDDDFIARYGMTRSAYNDYLAELEAQKNCDNCQYFTYSTDDARDDYTVQDVDDAYFATVDDDVSSSFTDDYQNNNDDGNNYNYNGGNRRTLRQQPKNKPFLAPVEEEFKKYELEFWNDMNSQFTNGDRLLYENSYGGVDDWNMCEQVHKYGMYCDEDCQSLDAFSSNQWSSADIVLLSIMCTFMATMMVLIVAKHKRAARTILKQQSFYSANDYDPTHSGIDSNQVSGLPPTVMYTIFGAIILTILALALVNFVNETLVFAVVCCILFFIYMLKITLFSVQKRPVLLASPNHEDVFGYNSADFGFKKGGFFS